jgi:hypothetical protein
LQQSITIKKHPQHNAASDYALLRQKGLEYIQNLGSKFWTDYNIHDPGITLLEALCYALTDLGYRTGRNIKDLLAVPPDTTPDHDRQGFFTARRILTNSSLTIDDYRKLLIDIDGVKNGWLHPKACPCEGFYLYANCAESRLQYVPTAPPLVPVLIRGLYDVLVAFDDDEKTGNLNSGKVAFTFNYLTTDGLATALIELRLPSWQGLEAESERYRLFRKPTCRITAIVVETIAKVKRSSGLPITDIDLEDGNVLRRPVFVTLTVTYDPEGNGETNPLPSLRFEDLPMSLWFGSSTARKGLQDLQTLKDALSDISEGGIVPRYLAKIKRADAVVAQTRSVLHASRNLAEDYCSIQAIGVEEFAVCADMEVTTDADIEAVLATAYYRIDQYFSPDIRFYSLKELVDAGMPVDEIFEGPQLSNGFINNSQLRSTQLKQVLHVSDIINLLADIEGVQAVKNVVLTRYDADGNIALKKDVSGRLVCDVASWSMPVRFNHQPRLYIEASKILVFKNGLPFLPDGLELSDTLQVVKGKNALSKFSVTENDFPVPTGRYFDLKAYYPVQNTLPQTYGVGEAGLPATASALRRAQAQQLKAYLLFFEQLLVNYLAQLAHISDLFALDKTVKHTYFSEFIGNEMLQGIEDSTNGLYQDFSAAKLEGLIEKPFSGDVAAGGDPVFLDRRNRFLDHMLARFGEQFNDYALMLYAVHQNKQKTDAQLISDKIDYLKAFPFTSANRGRAMNYKDAAHVCHTANVAGLQKRIELLLNLDDEGFLTYFEWHTVCDAAGTITERRWQLVDEGGEVYLRSLQNYAALSMEQAMDAGKKEMAKVYQAFTNPDQYTASKTSKWSLNLQDSEGNVVATANHLFTTKTAALAEKDRIVAFAQKIKNREALFVVEHLLLRPRNKPDAALYFELYEERDTDGVLFERRWRLIDAARKIYLSSSTRYFDEDLEAATQKARAEIAAVCRHIYNPARFQIKKEIKWVLNLLDDTGEVIATRKQHFATQGAAIAARDRILQLVAFHGAEGTPLGTEHLLHTTEVPLPGPIPGGDPLLPVCLSGNCGGCGDEDPYSFRITVVVNGEDGPAATDMAFRDFAEQTIRLEAPAHLGVKVCWVSKKQLRQFAAVYCRWRTELAKPEPDALVLHQRLVALLQIFSGLKNIYPPATLHDCVDGNDENRVLLGRTII